MKGRGATRRVVIINDELFPFRLPFFRAMHRARLSLRILFLARPRHRRWIPPEDLGVPHEYLSGFTVHLTKPSYRERRDVHLPVNLLWRLTRLRPQLVVAYAFSVPTWIAAFYCFLVGIPLVLWSEGTRHTEKENSKLQNLARRMVIPRAQAFLAGSNAARERLVELGADPSNVCVIAHAADAQIFGVTIAGSRSPRELLYVGALSQLKGMEHLLEIFSLVRDRIPEATLRLVGDGPMRSRLERRAERRGMTPGVRFDGFVQQIALTGIYADAGVFVFPTLRDTFGQVLAEAAASGLPIVTSPFAGAADEFVVAGRNGFVRNPRDHEGFASAIASIIADPTRRSAFAAASLGLAEAKDVSNVVKPAVALLRNLVPSDGASTEA